MNDSFPPWPCRVLLVDENDDYLDGLTDWFECVDEIDVIGRAHSCDEWRRKIDRLRPDLVLADMTLPDGNGFDVVRMVKTMLNPPLVVLMSFLDSDAFRSAAVSEGADGCITKADVPAALVPHLTTLFKDRGRLPIDRRAGTMNAATPGHEYGEAETPQHRKG